MATGSIPQLTRQAEYQQGHGRAIGFHPDKPLWATARTGTIHLWDGKELLKSIEIPGYVYGSIRFRKDDVYVGTWRINTQTYKKTNVLPDSSILVAAIDEEDEPNPDQFSARHVEWSLDAKQLVVRTVFHQTRERGARDTYQGPDSQVIILDASQPELIAELDVDSDFLSERGLAVCSQWIATGGNDVDVWYLTNGESLHLLESTDFCQSVCFSPDEMYLATTHNGGNICVWETHEWLDNITWQAHKNVTRGVAFHPTLPVLASFSDDTMIKVWSLETSSPEQIAQIEMERDIEGLAFNPAGTQLYITANYPAPAVSIYDLP